MAIREARGTVIVAVDADWTISANLLEQICAAVKSGYSASGSMVLLERYSLPLILTGAIVQLVLLRNGVALGVQFFERRQWEEVGGYDETILSGEDIHLAVRLKRQCRSSNSKYHRFWTGYCIISTRKFDRLGDWHYLRNLSTTLLLLRSNDRSLADRYWYEWER